MQVDTVLGLWSRMLSTTVQGEQHKVMLQKISQIKSEVFPTEYFGGLIEELENMVAQGELEDSLSQNKLQKTGSRKAMTHSEMKIEKDSTTVNSSWGQV